jgi:hypothetical protein
MGRVRGRRGGTTSVVTIVGFVIVLGSVVGVRVVGVIMMGTVVVVVVVVGVVGVVSVISVLH